MDESDRMKWRYTFGLLGAVLGWAAFCLFWTYRALSSGATFDILAASGTNVLLGALIAKWGDANQYWFRKKKKADEKDVGAERGK